jgi:hypothetical protein
VRGCFGCALEEGRAKEEGCLFGRERVRAEGRRRRAAGDGRGGALPKGSLSLSLSLSPAPPLLSFSRHTERTSHTRQRRTTKQTSLSSASARRARTEPAGSLAPPLSSPARAPPSPKAPQSHRPREAATDDGGRSKSSSRQQQAPALLPRRQHRRPRRRASRRRAARRRRPENLRQLCGAVVGLLLWRVIDLPPTASPSPAKVGKQATYARTKTTRSPNPKPPKNHHQNPAQKKRKTTARAKPASARPRADACITQAPPSTA